jgi:hypothetical protein
MSLSTTEWITSRVIPFLKLSAHWVIANPRGSRCGRDKLADELLAYLVDKRRLVRMAETGRRHVLANHTRSGVAHHMLKEILGCSRS